MTSKTNRMLENWIGTFMEYMIEMPSPDIYNRWTAYNIIAGALERRVWTKTSGSNLYPNMITMLVGAPGVGKSIAIKEAKTFWDATKSFNVTSRRATKEIFMGQIGLLTKTFHYKDKACVYTPLLAPVDEIASLLYDPELVNTICDLYDCPNYFELRTRKDGSIKHDKPYLNMITATQPRYLIDTLQEVTYGIGFMSRTTMIYSSHHFVRHISKSAADRERLKIRLVNDLLSIGDLVGEFTWTPEAQGFLESWNKKGIQDDAPKHKKLGNYNTRRVIHCIKLAMVLSVSSNEELQISMENVKDAITILVEAENAAVKIFEEVAA